MMAYIADIADFQQQVPRDFSLNAKIVLIGNRSNLLRIEEGYRCVDLLIHRHRAETRREGLAGKSRKSVAELERTLGLGLGDRVTGRCREAERSDVADRI